MDGRGSRSRIFLNYRRVDSAWAATMLYASLAMRFGAGSVFRDVAEHAELLPGSDFRRVIDAEVARSYVLLALIGDRWIDVAYDEGPRKGQRRLDDPDDLVRVEIETAFARRVRVIPVIVGHHNHPPAYHELPPGQIRELAARNAAFVRPGGSVDAQISTLLELVDLARRDPDEPWEVDRAPDVTVTVTFAPHPALEDHRVELHCGTVRTVGQLADEVWAAAGGRIPPYTYGTFWVLRNARTGGTIAHARLLHRLPPGEHVRDTRGLVEVGIAPGDVLEVVPPDVATPASAPMSER